MITKIYGAGTRMCIFDIGVYRVKDNTVLANCVGKKDGDMGCGGTRDWRCGM